MSATVIWFLVGVALFGSELFMPMFVLFFFGLGAWAAGLVSVFVTELPVTLSVFSVTSVVSLVLLRKVLVRTFTGRVRLADSADGATSMQAGKLCVITVAIDPPHAGEVSLSGSFWRAVADKPIAVGATAQVVDHVQGDELMLRVVEVTDATAANDTNNSENPL